MWDETVSALKARTILWSVTDRPNIYCAIVDGVTYTIRLNRFPDEPASTMLFDDHEIDVEDIPLHWHWNSTGAISTKA
jgi:hypothetical protein